MSNSFQQLEVQFPDLELRLRAACARIRWWASFPCQLSRLLPSGNRLHSLLFSSHHSSLFSVPVSPILPPVLRPTSQLPPCHHYSFILVFLPFPFLSPAPAVSAATLQLSNLCSSLRTLCFLTLPTTLPPSHTFVTIVEYAKVISVRLARPSKSFDIPLKPLRGATFVPIQLSARSVPTSTSNLLPPKPNNATDDERGNHCSKDRNNKRTS